MVSKHTIGKCAKISYDVNKKWNNLDNKEDLIDDIKFQLSMSMIEVTDENIKKVYNMVKTMQKHNNPYIFADKLVIEKGNAEIMYYGMQSCVQQIFNIDNTDCNSTTAVNYIVDTFIECIDNQDFFDWILNGNKNGKPKIWSEWDFKREFKTLFEIPAINNISSAIEFIKKIYNVELWLDYFEYGESYIYTTMYKDFDIKIDYLTYITEIERLCTMLEFEIATNGDVQDTIDTINLFLNNYFDKNKYSLDNVYDFIEELETLLDGV